MNDMSPQPEPSAPGELAKLEPSELGRKWVRNIAAARKHWEKLHKRIEHNRKLVAGFNWQQDPKTGRFIDPRANLIFSTVQATLPNIYARNPDVSVTGNWRNSDTKLFCETLQTVLSRQTKRANLKRRAKMSVISALVSYLGVLKVTYQRDIEDDPVIAERIPDTQDNILALDAGVRQVQDPQARDQAELHGEELREIVAGVEEQSEVIASEGLVIDRVLTENLLMDPAVCEFYDYEHADWLAQLVPMKRGAAQARYRVDLSGAKAFKPDGLGGVQIPGDEQPLAMDAQNDGKTCDDDMICIIEIWDRVAQRVHTMADGCEFFVRQSYSPPRVGNRWYPFFVLPYAVLDGQFVAPCLVDLTEKLQDEHNSTRDKFAAHRELNRPGWIASADTNMKTLKRHVDALLGEVVLIDSEGKPLNQVIVPKQPIPVNPADYDTGLIRQDWEQVTGLQDAMRSTVVQPKTATEAGIMQQSLAGRTAEFRDKVEDWLAEIYNYAAQVLLMELTPAQVERYTGPNREEIVIDPMTGMPAPVIVERAYEWPQLSRDEVYDMVEIDIVAGSTGAPDKQQAQETWAQALPVIQPLVTQIMQLAAQGIDYGPLEALLRETLKRFDDRIDMDQFLPAKHAPAQPQAQQQPAPPDAAVPA